MSANDPKRTLRRGTNLRARVARNCKPSAPLRLLQGLHDLIDAEARRLLVNGGALKPLPKSRSQACRSFGATSTCAIHVAEWRPRSPFLSGSNARPEAGPVYGAIDMPWAKLVGQIAQAYDR
jgi:hypothetical protein